MEKGFSKREEVQRQQIGRISFSRKFAWTLADGNDSTVRITCIFYLKEFPE